MRAVVVLRTLPGGVQGESTLHARGGDRGTMYQELLLRVPGRGAAGEPVGVAESVLLVVRRQVGN